MKIFEKSVYSSITVALALLIISLAIVVTVGAVSMYKDYNDTELQKQVIELARQKDVNIRVRTNSNVSGSFRASQSGSLSSLGSDELIITVKAVNREQQYIKYPDGSIAYPYSSIKPSY